MLSLVSEVGVASLGGVLMLFHRCPGDGERQGLGRVGRKTRVKEGKISLFKKSTFKFESYLKLLFY